MCVLVQQLPHNLRRKYVIIFLCPCFPPLCGCAAVGYVYNTVPSCFHSSEVLHLRQHLSMSMISKLLDGRCTYRPRARVFKVPLFPQQIFLMSHCSSLMFRCPFCPQLRHLRSYLPLMRPSSLLKQMPNYSSENQTDIITLDQEVNLGLPV